jgi:hypothetical protein
MQTMKQTTDTYSGMPFRYNSTCLYELRDGSRWLVPERVTSRSTMWLHPGRTPDKLLAALNDGRTWPGERSTYEADLAKIAP